MNLSIWIALRHLAAMRRRSFLGRVSLLAILGVGVGVGTLVTVLAFTGGFQTEVRELLTGMNPSIFITGEGEGGVDPDGALAAELLTREDVLALAPFVQQKGVLSRPGDAGLKLAGCLIRGVDPELEREVTSILESSQPPLDRFLNVNGKPGILLGRRLAEELAVLPGEEINFTTLLDGSDEPRHKVFFVQGFVESGLYEFDRRFAYVDLQMSREVFRASGGVDGLGLRVTDPMEVRRTSRELRLALSYPPWRVADWMDLNGEIFRWMGTMRSILFLSLSLIVLVAGFNIAGTMTLVVSEKSREIGVLRSLGAGRGTILKVFVLEGWVLGISGVALGLLLSWVMALVFEGRPLGIPGEVYFIDHLPMQLDLGQVAGVSSVAVLVTLAAAFFPGIEALMRRPIEALGGMASAGGDVVRGWLRFFVTLYVYLVPMLGALTILVLAYLAWTQTINWTLLTVIPSLFALGISIYVLIYGVLVGISLNMLEPGSVRRVNRFLFISWLAMVTPFWILRVLQLGSESMLAWVPMITVFASVYFAVWILYFRLSRRVKLAFSSNQENG
jgi:lipoprotein-releasing system permease protein